MSLCASVLGRGLFLSYHCIAMSLSWHVHLEAFLLRTEV